MEEISVQGASVPALGIGTWRSGGETCQEAVRAALDVGYRHVDTAQAYGNERDVGVALREAAVDRDDVFLTTKIPPTKAGTEDFQDAVQASLDRLNVSTIDLVLLHWPAPGTPFRDTARGMAAVLDEGLVRHVGVSNFSKRRLETARAVSPVPLLTDQVQFHPFYPQQELLRYCQDESLLLTGYSPLGHGGVLQDELLQRIGRRYEKSPAQVALRWATQHQNVAVIPKASSREHVEENLDIFDFRLDRDEIDRIRRPSYLRTGLSWLRGRFGV